MGSLSSGWLGKREVRNFSSATVREAAIPAISLPLHPTDPLLKGSIDSFTHFLNYVDIFLPDVGVNTIY